MCAQLLRAQGATTLVADSHSERIPIEETFLRHAA
jgi:hypothetical protein